MQAHSAPSPRLESVVDVLDELSAMFPPPLSYSPSSYALTIPTDSSSSSSSSPSPPRRTEKEEQLERKRAKARDKARRKYHCKMARLQSLRVEVKQLERQLKALALEQKHNAVSTAPGTDERVLIAAATSSSLLTTRREVEDRLRLLLEYGARLRRDNSQLRQRFAAMRSVATRLEELLSRSDRPYIVFASKTLFLRPMTPPECVATQLRAMEVVRIFSVNPVLKAPLTRQVSGWYERREVDGGLFRYMVQKRFRGCEPVETLAAKTFARCTAAKGMQEFYSEGLMEEWRLVQKVDDDNFVFYQQMRAMDPENELAVTKGLVLVSRLKTANGYRTCIYGLELDQLPLADPLAFEQLADPPSVAESTAEPDATRAPPAVTEVWNNQFCWIQIERIMEPLTEAGTARCSSSGGGGGGGETEVGCALTYAGVKPTVGSNARFWMAEVVLSCLRWQHAMIGPVVSFPSSDGAMERAAASAS